ncbi:DUF2167 domain-containing protein [Pelagicoccus sp. SDUM812002]|uniref:DUF2167 domain-containing protein n=1 Tax=Pelagicoccus sp. SDUM812002 TaxID=3041266 RepID=UPI00280E3F65|nr:DUF2167 domain-containing protein [Pelagicoccus sp. SDUM812002]MDQ8187143.1 DUF2167 domain-containing protein [Pelagicoccus sp. SDUM812002]
MKTKLLLVALPFLAFLSSPAFAQDENALTEEQARAEAQAKWDAFMQSLAWQDQGTGELKEWATIEIPDGFRYLDGEDASRLMQAYGNLPSEYEGLIATNDLDWLVLFQFDPTGYVKDDEKDELDPDALLDQLKENQEAGNQYRREQGLAPMYIDGWAMEPRYNEYTNNLEWGLLLRSGDNPNPFVNYETKLLGREGVMEVTLICDLEDMQMILPNYQDLLLGHQYKEGKSYAEYRQGDKIAEYGLTALIAGGALYGAAKLGFLGTILAFGKKFLKFIIIGLVAIGAAFKKFFARMSGREVVDEQKDTPAS